MSIRVALQRVEPERIRSGFAEDVIGGLTRTPKRLPPKYFYDAEGSRLFDLITQQPEYYPTRTELAILQAHAPAIAAMMPPGAALIEFGMGKSQKVRLLLQAARQLAAYVPVDIAPESLQQESRAIAADYPNLAVLPVVADFTQRFELPDAITGKPRVGFFPGSTIGNFEPHEATRFLQRATAVLGEGALLIIGVDRVKDSRILHAAYNDARGVTAAFNLNLLARINRELGGDFRLDCFEHHAFFNRQFQRVEMHLASLKRQKVRVDGETVEFRAGETIHTENSYKYAPQSFGALARGAGWQPVALWSDAQSYFSVHALQAEPIPLPA